MKIAIQNKLDISKEAPYRTEFDGDKYEIEITTDDNRVAYGIYINKDGSIDFRSQNTWKDPEGKLKNTSLLVKPRASNNVIIKCEDYE